MLIAFKFWCRLFFDTFPFPLITGKLLGDFFNNRPRASDCLVRFIFSDRNYQRKAGKSEKPESQENLNYPKARTTGSRNDQKARATGKSGTTGIVPVSIFWHNDASRSNRRTEFATPRIGKTYFANFFLVQPALPIRAKCFGVPIVLAHYT